MKSLLPATICPPVPTPAAVTPPTPETIAAYRATALARESAQDGARERLEANPRVALRVAAVALWEVGKELSCPQNGGACAEGCGVAPGYTDGRQTSFSADRDEVSGWVSVLS